MKFLAILRDSLRETLDVKLFYVMVGISVLTVLLIGSITYQPVTVERQLRFISGLANHALMAQARQKMRLHFEIENFERTDKAVEPWLGEYAFDHVIQGELNAQAGVVLPDEQKEFDEMRKGLQRSVTPESVAANYRGLFREVEVKPAPARPDLPPQTFEVRHHVVGKGTWVKSRQEWYHEPALFFGLVPVPLPMFKLSDIVRFIADWVIGTFGAAFTLLLSTILTASFLPTMLSKGTIDLLLVKPIHRTTLFLYKFLGGLLFMFLNTVVIMTGIWLAVGLQTGEWLHSFLVCILVFTLEFAIFYSVSALTAVLTRSTIVCILIAFMTWGTLFGLGWAHYWFIENRRETAEPAVKTHWAFVGFDVFCSLTPRYKELDWLTNRMIALELIRLRPQPAPDPSEREAVAEYEKQQKRAAEIYEQQRKEIEKKYGSYSWTTSLSVTGAFIVLMLACSCALFAYRDY
jgi:hypothetical protein